MSDTYIQVPISSVNSEVKDWSCLKIHDCKPHHAYIYAHVEGLSSKPSWTVLPM